MTESFPRQQARTRRFSLGVPRAFTISPDGTRVVFLRTKSGADPVTCLWQLDVASGTERLVADPTALNAADEDLPPEEKARRGRAREQSGGIVSYAADGGPGRGTRGRTRRGSGWPPSAPGPSASPPSTPPRTRRTRRTGPWPSPRTS